MAYRKPDPALPKLGARLALTRRALDLTRFQMAQLLGTDMPTWGTYEAGLVRIPPDEALKLAPYGIPLNWIYEGKMANLPPHIRAKIRKIGLSDGARTCRAGRDRTNSPSKFRARWSELPEYQMSR